MSDKCPRHSSKYRALWHPSLALDGRKKSASSVKAPGWAHDAENEMVAFHCASQSWEIAGVRKGIGGSRKENDLDSTSEFFLQYR